MPTFIGSIPSESMAAPQKTSVAAASSYWDPSYQLTHIQPTPHTLSLSRCLLPRGTVRGCTDTLPIEHCLHAQWLEKLFCSLVGLFQQFIIGAQEGTVELPLGNSYINPACWKCCCRQVICPGDVFLQESYQGFFCSVNVIPLFFLPTKLFTYCCSSLAFQQSRQDHHPGVSLSTVMEPLSWTNICLPYPVHHL